MNGCKAATHILRQADYRHIWYGYRICPSYTREASKTKCRLDRHALAYRPTYIFRYVHMRIHTHTYIHKHKCIHIHRPTYTYYIHTSHIHNTYIHPHMYIHTYTIYTHAYTYTHIHTYIHAQTDRQTDVGLLLVRFSLLCPYCRPLTGFSRWTYTVTSEVKPVAMTEAISSSSA